ncbi:MAG: metal-dependent transcriptional regulator [Methanobacteriaceae archaeon]|nr:metal-dependent transcriptional regulator [Methanobacteriaceae archaeon]
MHGKEISENVEEYLETIYKMSFNSGVAKTTAISKDLNIAPGSVTQMLKKLEKKGYVKYYQYKGVKLTDKGYKIAEKIVRKHRLLETFLFDVLDIKKEHLHEQACAMEHSLSDEAERKLCHLLKQPDQCPDDHNIIPACHFKLSSCDECLEIEDIADLSKRITNLVSIADMQTNQKGKIKFIRGSDKIFEKLLEKDITLESEVELISKTPFDGSIKVNVDGKEKIIDKDTSFNVFVERYFEENFIS